MKKILDHMKLKGYLPSPELLKLPESELTRFVETLTPASGMNILTQDLYTKYKQQNPATKKIDLGSSKVEIIRSFGLNKSVSSTNSFVSFYNYRFARLSEFVKRRPEMQSAVSIKHLSDTNASGDVKFVGMIVDIRYTSNQNAILEIEDPTGGTRVLVANSKKELFLKVKELVLDEVIGVIGSRKGNIVFANDLVFPDIPSSFEYKRAPDNVTAAFVSDVHIGSVDFLPDKFQKFIDWTRGRVGTEKNKTDAERLAYVFVTGDLVDGVGIYPNQDEELNIKDIYAQYDAFEEYIKQIPDHINVIMCPGNHDAVRLEEPQPVLGANLLKTLCQYKNVTLVSNPSFLTIHGIDGFSGLKTLMYHGYSLDHYCAENEYIRNKGGYDNIGFAMEFLLRKRHLSPTHSASPFISGSEDSLIIDPVPDIFVAGHTHKGAVHKYKHIDVLSSSCFQKATSFQEKLGHHPNPGVVPLLNLKTRHVTVMET